MTGKTRENTAAAKLAVIQRYIHIECRADGCYYSCFTPRDTLELLPAQQMSGPHESEEAALARLLYQGGLLSLAEIGKYYAP